MATGHSKFYTLTLARTSFGNRSSGVSRLRGDALVVGEAAERVERLAVGFQPIGKRIGAEALAPFAGDAPPPTAPECARR